MKRPVHLLIFSVAVLRLALASKLGLSDDEAYYWEWSRHLGLSYYDHPPLMSWLIWLSTTLFGTSPLTVRIPAILLSTTSIFLLFQIAKDFFGQHSALASCMLYLLIPLFGLGSMMSVPDIPLCFFWLVVFFLGWKLLDPAYAKKTNLWALLGLCMGLGILSKYTMVLSGLAYLLFLFWHRPWLLKKPQVWLAVLISFVVASPILVWNAQNNWASLHFQGTSRFHFTELNWTGPLLFIFSQAAYLSPLALILLLYVARRSFASQDLRLKYIYFFWLIPFSVFAIQSLVNEFKPHWPAPAYLSLTVASGFFLARFSTNWGRTFTYCLVFTLALNAFLYLNLVTPFISAVTSQSLHLRWIPKWDPTNDLYGWDDVARYLAALKQNGSEFELAAHRYEISSPLAFATQSKVWDFSSGTNQYRFFQPKEELEAIKNRTVIIVGHDKYRDFLHEDRKFSSCEKLPNLIVKRFKQTARIFEFWKCKFAQTNVQNINHLSGFGGRPKTMAASKEHSKR